MCQPIFQRNLVSTYSLSKNNNWVWGTSSGSVADEKSQANYDNGKKVWGYLAHLSAINEKN